ncbi:hypothetical protein ACJX0J_008247, partial [Zea mays]
PATGKFDNNINLPATGKFDNNINLALLIDFKLHPHGQGHVIIIFIIFFKFWHVPFNLIYDLIHALCPCLRDVTDHKAQTILSIWFYIIFFGFCFCDLCSNDANTSIFIGHNQALAQFRNGLTQKIFALGIFMFYEEACLIQLFWGPKSWPELDYLS